MRERLELVSQGIHQARPTLGERLVGEPSVLRVGGALLPVVEVGDDYLLAGRAGKVLVPTRYCIVGSAAHGEQPEIVGRNLIEVLEEWAVDTPVVSVKTREVELRGQLVDVAPDHISLRTPMGETIHAGVDAITLVKLAADAAR